MNTYEINLKNNLDKFISLIPDYYKKFSSNSKLITILPALQKDDNNAQPYYSVGLSDDDNKRVSPVFLIINPSFDIDNFSEDDLFIFDNEILYSYDRNKYGKLKKTKSADFDKIIQNIYQNPVVLVFQGCDDGHVAKRFKNQDEAFEFLNLLDVFEDVFQFNTGFIN